MTVTQTFNTAYVASNGELTVGPSSTYLLHLRHEISPFEDRRFPMQITWSSFLIDS